MVYFVRNLTFNLKLIETAVVKIVFSNIMVSSHFRRIRPPDLKWDCAKSLWIKNERKFCTLYLQTQKLEKTFMKTNTAKKPILRFKPCDPLQVGGHLNMRLTSYVKHLIR